jgi:hypothetical protein
LSGRTGALLHQRDFLDALAAEQQNCKTHTLSRAATRDFVFGEIDY